MAWLTSLLNRPATVDKEAEPSEQDAATAEEGASQPSPSAGGPRLAILAPDIAGISSFRLRFFQDAASAAAGLEEFTPEMRRGTHAFWALHDEPVLPPEGHCEALVLIRANAKADVVYAVSFIDLESAWSFARFEAKRGLDISHLIILWAAFATVREELNGVTVLPQSPPATKTQPEAISPPPTAVEIEATETVREYERREEPEIRDSVAAPEAPSPERPSLEPPDADKQAKLAEAEAEAEARRREKAKIAEAERRAEAARRQAAEEAERRAEAARRQAAEEAEQRAEAARRQAAEEASRIAKQAQERLRAARAAADAARAQAEAEATRRLEAERRLEEQRLAAEDAARASVLADMQSRIESAHTVAEAIVEEPVVLDATSVALEGLAEASTQDQPRTIEAATGVESYTGDEETPTGQPFADEEEPVARGTVFAHAPAIPTAEDAATVEVPGPDALADDSRDGDDDTPKVPELDDFDIAYEVARLLENRRWDKREEPFQGFDSPPGKF